MISNVDSGTHLPPPRKVQARGKPAHTRFGVAGRPAAPRGHADIQCPARSRSETPLARLEASMRRFQGCLAVVVLLTASPLLAQSKAKVQNVPEIPYDSAPNALKLPDNLYLGEGIGGRHQLEGPRVRLHAQRRDAALRVRSERNLRQGDRPGSLRLPVRARGPRRQGRQHLGRRRRVEHGRSSSTRTARC